MRLYGRYIIKQKLCSFGHEDEYIHDNNSKRDYRLVQLRKLRIKFNLKIQLSFTVGSYL